MSKTPDKTDRIDWRLIAAESQAEAARLRAQVSAARTIILAGVDLMTPDQVGQWRGVRSWLEQDTEDYLEGEGAHAVRPYQEGDVTA